MPPRKSDQRKSDVSSARSAPKDDHHPEAASSTVTAAAAADTSTTSAAHAPATSTTSASAADGHDAAQDKKQPRDADTTTIEDLTLPKSIITRLAKGVLPANTQIQANAVLAMSKSTTVFVNYLASYANEHTTNAGKKTIAPADVFKALDDVEFGFLRERLEAEFAKFNAIQTEKRTSYRNKVKAAKQDPNASTAGDTSMADTTVASGADNTTTTTTTTDTKSNPAGGDEAGSSLAADAAHRAKKQRVDPSAPGDEEHDDAETEDEQGLDEDEDMPDDEVEEDEDGEEDGDEGQGSGDETQDAIEERDVGGSGGGGGGDDDDGQGDEALDGDESD